VYKNYLGENFSELPQASAIPLECDSEDKRTGSSTILNINNDNQSMI
jgi:hypothetical protein